MLIVESMKFFKAVWQLFVLAAMEIINKNLLEFVSPRPACARLTICATPQKITPIHSNFAVDR